MALSITTELQSTYYTCDIPNIGINTDRASLVFTLRIEIKRKSARKVLIFRRVE